MDPLPRVSKDTQSEFLGDITQDDYFTSVMEQVKASNETLSTYLRQYYHDGQDAPYVISALFTYDLLQRALQKEGKEMPTISEDTLENVIEVITTRQAAQQEGLQRVKDENPLVYHTVTNRITDPMGMIIMYELIRSQELSNRLQEDFAHGA